MMISSGSAKAADSVAVDLLVRTMLGTRLYRCWRVGDCSSGTRA